MLKRTAIKRLKGIQTLEDMRLALQNIEAGLGPLLAVSTLDYCHENTYAAYALDNEPNSEIKIEPLTSIADAMEIPGFESICIGECYIAGTNGKVKKRIAVYRKK
jgi:hypothetical protein